MLLKPHCWQPKSEVGSVVYSFTRVLRAPVGSSFQNEGSPEPAGRPRSTSKVPLAHWVDRVALTADAGSSRFAPAEFVIQRRSLRGCHPCKAERRVTASGVRSVAVTARRSEQQE